MPSVSSLFVYPVKGCAGTSVLEMSFDARGPVGDRRWMVVDDDGRFLSQREHPRLRTVVPRPSPGGLELTASGMQPLTLESNERRPVEIRVWDYRGMALDEGPLAAAWFSEVLGTGARLVRFDERTHRPVSREHTDVVAEIAFADAYPVLLISLESLGDLNRRLEQPLPMNRFRPNVVVRDCHPFEEDTWSRIEAPELTLSVVKPCTRCVVTTIDQRTGARGKEPLKTLATFRREASSVIFGQNCVHHGTGTLRVGDALNVRFR